MEIWDYPMGPSSVPDNPRDKAPVARPCRQPHRRTQSPARRFATRTRRNRNEAERYPHELWMDWPCKNSPDEKTLRCALEFNCACFMGYTRSIKRRFQTLIQAAVISGPVDPCLTDILDRGAKSGHWESVVLI